MREQQQRGFELTLIIGTILQQRSKGTKSRCDGCFSTEPFPPLVLCRQPACCSYLIWDTRYSWRLPILL